MFYRCPEKKNKFGCGFVVRSRFIPVADRLATICIRGKFYTITLIYAHAPMEKVEDEIVLGRYGR